MAGTLYIVATPIGNLEDMPPRVAATFSAADFIAAEDTRVTMKLLNYLGLKKPMVSYYEHALQKGEAILQRIEAGESCALCSDAGMPCVSDPGEVIVRDALARGIKVVPIPAASACVTALAVSGQDTSRWVFEGFLPVNRKQKKERLAELLQEKRTVIFYEAPHKLRTTLDDLTAAFGACCDFTAWSFLCNFGNTGFKYHRTSLCSFCFSYAADSSGYWTGRRIDYSLSTMFHI